MPDVNPFRSDKELDSTARNAQMPSHRLRRKISNLTFQEL